MKQRKLLKTLLLAVVTLSSSPSIVSECTAIFTSSATAIEDNNSVTPKGTIIAYASQYRVDSRTNDKSVCFRGGYCYPADKIKLSCGIDWKSGVKSDYQAIYYFK